MTARSASVGMGVTGAWSCGTPLMPCSLSTGTAGLPAWSGSTRSRRRVISSIRYLSANIACGARPNVCLSAAVASMRFSASTSAAKVMDTRHRAIVVPPFQCSRYVVQVEVDRHRLAVDQAEHPVDADRRTAEDAETRDADQGQTEPR